VVEHILQQLMRQQGWLEAQTWQEMQGIVNANGRVQSLQTN